MNPGYTCFEVAVGTNPADPRVEHRPRAMNATAAFETHIFLNLNCSVDEDLRALEMGRRRRRKRRRRRRRSELSLFVPLRTLTWLTTPVPPVQPAATKVGELITCILPAVSEEKDASSRYVGIWDTRD